MAISTRSPFFIFIIFIAITLCAVCGCVYACLWSIHSNNSDPILTRGRFMRNKHSFQAGNKISPDSDVKANDTRDISCNRVMACLEEGSVTDSCVCVTNRPK